MAGTCVLCKTPTTRQCGGCKLVYYCSVICQKSNWQEHIPDCFRNRNKSPKYDTQNTERNLEINAIKVPISGKISKMNVHKASKNKKKVIEHSSEVSTSKEATEYFNKLPNEVIEMILKFLSPKEILKFGLTNQRMMNLAKSLNAKITLSLHENKAIIEEILKWKESRDLVKELWFKDDCNQINGQEMFGEANNGVSILVNKSRIVPENMTKKNIEETIEKLVKKCHQVEKIQIHHDASVFGYGYKLFEGLKLLGIGDTKYLTNEVFQSLANFPALRELVLVQFSNFGMEGYYGKLSFVRIIAGNESRQDWSVAISTWSNGCDIEKIAQNCQNIKELSLKGSNVSDTTFETIAANCPQLISLKINDNVINSNLSENSIKNFFVIRKLTKLTLQLPNENVFKKIVENAAHLKSLDISWNFSNVTDDVIESIANNCKELERLNIAYTNVSTKGLEAILIELGKSIKYLDFRRCDRITNDSLELPKLKLTNIAYNENVLNQDSYESDESFDMESDEAIFFDNSFEDYPDDFNDYNEPDPEDVSYYSDTFCTYLYLLILFVLLILIVAELSPNRRVQITAFRYKLEYY